LKHGGTVYTKIIPDASAPTLMPIIELLMFAIERSVDLDQLSVALRLQLGQGAVSRF